MNFSTAASSCNMNLTGIPYIIFISCHSLSGLVALTGSSLVLMTIYKSRTLHTPSNMFIASLAAADALVGLIINPLYITLTSTNTWVSFNPLYKVENYMWVQTLVTTSFSLSAISVDRFFAVLFPFQYRKSKMKPKTKASSKASLHMYGGSAENWYPVGGALNHGAV
ncbi:D(4) dopamine receptor-like [Actinia tenebrosa]|uniref:D(4) dopamine receptor-like n=1 Tax=Actinia tenebrosa TaxID=6105 RepID=A0A6P8HFM1_ACTTE|nr:D(4) dopamine receptor-like [Actinia tenebrosa]